MTNFNQTAWLTTTINQCKLERNVRYELEKRRTSNLEEPFNTKDYSIIRPRDLVHTNYQATLINRKCDVKNNLTKFALAIVLVDRAGRVLPEVDDVACVEVVIVVASMPESGSVKIGWGLKFDLKGWTLNFGITFTFKTCFLFLHSRCGLRFYSSSHPGFIVLKK